MIKISELILLSVKRESELSRTRIKDLILNKNLKINNQIITDPSKKVLSKDNINITIPKPKKHPLNLTNSDWT